jgi:hypothetical protein
MTSAWLFLVERLWMGRKNGNSAGRLRFKFSSGRTFSHARAETRGCESSLSFGNSACRSLDQVRDAPPYGKETLKVLKKGLEAWADARKLKSPLERAYCTQLKRLVELSRDRCELYGVSEADRTAFATSCVVCFNPCRGI